MTLQNIAGVSLSAAFNDVSGTLINGFGGGPYFTSANDHTIDGTEDQKATAIGVEFSPMDGLELGVLHVDFDTGEKETDVYVIYGVNDRFRIDFIYTDLHDDGSHARLIAKYRFQQRQ